MVGAEGTSGYILVLEFWLYGGGDVFSCIEYTVSSSSLSSPPWKRRRRNVGCGTYLTVAPGWSVLSFSSDSVAGDACRWFCRLFLINLVIDVVVKNAVVHVHVSKASIALSVTLIIVRICTGQHDTTQNIMNPMVKSATLQVTSLRAVVDSLILSNFISVGSNILISWRFAAFWSTSFTLLRSTNSFCISILSVWNSCPSVVIFILWTCWISDIKLSISIDKSGVDRSGLIVSSMVGL